MSDTENATRHYFLPSVRRGLAAHALTPAGTDPRARVEVSVTARAYAKAAVEAEETIPQNVNLYGPGDVLGFDPRIVVRTEPAPDVGNFECNYFPAIEFADPDFPWRFTPDNPDAAGRLQPWIALVVLAAESMGGDVRREFEEGVPDAPHLPRCICVDAGLLPDLGYAWRWAHAQVTGGSGLAKDDLTEQLAAEPARGIGRLLCPRRLRPNTRYAAFVVPTFKIGLRAALGAEPDPRVPALAPAWGDGTVPAEDELCASGTLKLPYYYRWEFRTGEFADFEYLVRLLEPRTLSGIGTRGIDCANPGFGVRGVSRDDADPAERTFLGMEGALFAEGTEPTPWGMDNQRPEALRRGVAALVNGASGAFTVTAVAVKAVPGSSRAELSWHSAVPTTARVDYGLAPGYGFRAAVKVFRQAHAITLGDLLPGRPYTFRITALAADGASTTESTGSFTIPLLPCVLPPIYGRWHRAVDAVDAEGAGWLHELNLDPRHRTAAGLGAEVVRRRQEDLMAGAFEQLGPIQSVNDGLRLAQFGRDVSRPMYRRIESMPVEMGLYLTAPAMRRIIVLDPESNASLAATRVLHFRTGVPMAAVDPSFRRLLNPCGPILSRQRLFRGQAVSPGSDLLGRLAMGDPKMDTPRRSPAGTLRPMDVTRRLRGTLPATPEAALAARVPSFARIPRALPARLTVSIANPGNGDLTVTRIGLIDDRNGRFRLAAPSTPFTVPAAGAVDVTVLYGPRFARGVAAEASVKLIVETDDPDDPVQEIRIAGTRLTQNAMRWIVKKRSLKSAQDPGLRFADGRIVSEAVQEALAGDPLAGLPGIPDLAATAASAGATLDRLDHPPSGGDIEPSERPAGFVPSVADQVLASLNPDACHAQRVRQRLRLDDRLAGRLDGGASEDPLDPVMWAPEFSEPMYEPLRGISHESLLPGVEKIPQNTIGILYVNRRFIESYLCGMNHAFAGELLWRGYPTDQRGSYFRQFWDASKVLPNPREIEEVLRAWLENPASPLALAYGMEELERLLAGWLEAKGCDSIGDVPPEERDRILSRHRDGVRDVSHLTEAQRTALVGFLIAGECLEEKLKDVRPLTQWQDSPLGENESEAWAAPPSDEPNLVFVIRGELLRRYPDAAVYAIEGAHLDDAVRGNLHGAVRPIFEATLPPDLAVFGFPFTRREAAGTGQISQKYFIIEEHVSHTHFGLDEAGAGLSWASAGLGTAFGRYLDEAIAASRGDEGATLDPEASSARLAALTLQAPVRVFVPARRMIRP